MVIQPICPPWLKPLISAKFFEPCSNHSSSTEASVARIERNLFCLDCMSDPLCFGCTFTHKNHHIVQIRRSSYHDVIRVSEIQKVLDLSGVQSYIINSARVVFLNGRPQNKLAKGVTKTCEICERSLNDNYRYCSLGCKLQGISKSNDNQMTFMVHPKTQVRNVKHRVYPEDGSQRKARSPSKKVNVSSFITGEKLNAESSEVTISKRTYVEILPSTPPQEVHLRAAKRRKGTPHRSHLGSLHVKV